MSLAVITLQQVLILFLLILAGFACARLKILHPEGKKELSNLLLYLVVPAMIINSYLTGYDETVLHNLALAFVLSTAALLLGTAVTFLLTMRCTDRNAPILKFAGMFSNAAYMGFPLIEALYGSEGLIYAGAFVTMFNIFLWTIGYGLVSRSASPRQIARSILTSPVIWAVAAGLILFAARIQVPEILAKPLEYLGGMNTPLSMMITGMLIAQSGIGAMLRDRRVHFVLLIRMLAVPLLCFALFTALGLHGEVPAVILLLEACPSAAITSVFAVQFDYDEQLAAGSVVVTTLFSALTLPLIAGLL